MFTDHFFDVATRAMAAIDRSAVEAMAQKLAAVREALKQVSGTYGIAVMHEDAPSVIVGARLGSCPRQTLTLLGAKALALGD